MDYSIETQLISCNCSINTEVIEPKNEDKFNPKIIYSSFYDILKYSNYKVLKCYDLVLDYKSLLKNKGSIIVFAYFILYVFSIIAFAIKGISYLKIIVAKLQGNASNNTKEIKPVEKGKNSIKEKNNKMKNKKNQAYNAYKGNKGLLKKKNNKKNNPPVKKRKLNSKKIIMRIINNIRVIQMLLVKIL